MDRYFSNRTRLYTIYSLILSITFFCNCQSSEFLQSTTLESPGQCKLTSKGLFKGSLIGADGKAYVFVFSLTDYQSSEPDAYFSSIYAVDENCNFKKIYEIDERFNGPECFAIGEDNNIYFVLGDINNNNSFLYSLSTKGKVNWKVLLENGNNCEGIAIGNDGTIYVQLERVLYSISQDKNIKWNISSFNSIQEGPLIGEGDNLFIAYLYEGEGHLSSISKEGEINWSFDFGNELPERGVVGPSGNIYITSSIKGVAESLYLNSFNKEGNLNWKVLLGSGTVMEIITRGGILIDEDETIYISGVLKSIKAINSIDGSIKWNKEGNGILDFIDGQGNIYLLEYEGYKEKIFDKNGNVLSVIGPEDGIFSVWSLVNDNYFYNYDGLHNFFIYQALGSGYSKSSWPMRYHDPQNTNRWNGGF